jgi:hypothetical protein
MQCCAVCAVLYCSLVLGGPVGVTCLDHNVPKISSALRRSLSPANNIPAAGKQRAKGGNVPFLPHFTWLAESYQQVAACSSQSPPQICQCLQDEACPVRTSLVKAIHTLRQGRAAQNEPQCHKQQLTACHKPGVNSTAVRVAVQNLCVTNGTAPACH